MLKPTRTWLSWAMMGVALCLPAGAQIRVPTPVDWSHKHLIITNAASPEERMTAAREPRSISNWLRRSQALAGARELATAKNRGQGRSKAERDWSVSLGAGRVAPAMSPAKYGFYSAVSCTADWVVYGLDTTPTAPPAPNVSGGQANLVFLRNLYSGTNGYCGVAPTVMAAYNVNTQSGGQIKTSPVISLDGTKVAFVESTGSSSIFHVLTLDPCTYSVSGCTTPGVDNGSSATSAAVPGVNNAASLVSIQYSNSNNTRSSPWIDYGGTGTAYVGDDNGRLYRILNVFSGTPTLDTTFGGSGSLVVNSGTKLTGPVLAQGWLLVGDSTGLLWAMQASSPYTLLASVQVGGGNSGGFTFGIVDPPVVDASTSGVLSAFVTSARSTSGKFVLAQANLNIGTQSLTIARTVNIGSGSTNSAINAHAPTFDNNYYIGTIDATHGFIYACGSLAASRHPTLYRMGFAAGSPPTMNASTTSGPSQNADAECSPMTEFANSNLAVTDLLFLGDNTGQVRSFDITGGMPNGAAATLNVPGGSSGIIADTTQLPTQQGSSIYFTSQSNVGGNCGANNYCAIKVTQAGLL